MFLEKYDEPPKRAAMICDSADAILAGGELEGWEDKDIFKSYLDQVGVGEADYREFVKGEKSWTHWKGHDYFGQYAKAFETSAEVRTTCAKNSFKRLSADDQDALLSERFYKSLLGTCGTEREKLRIFGMVYNQKTLIVKSPDDKNEERKFLGYSWSNRRGQEGIQIENAGGLLYNDSVRRAAGTIAAGIRESFADEVPNVVNGEEYTKFVSLRNLIDFSRVKFDKAIGMTARNRGKLPNGFSYLDTVAGYSKSRVAFSDIVASEYITTDNMLQNRCGIVPYVGNAVSGTVVEYKKGDTLISNIRPYLKKIWLSDRDGGCSPDVLVLRVKDKGVMLPEYLNICLSSDEFFAYTMEGKTGVKMPRGDKEDILKYGIHVPPLAIQKKIVAECAKLDAECEKQKKVIEDCQTEIEGLYAKVKKEENQQGWFKGKVEDVLLEVGNAGDKIPAKEIKSAGAIPVITQEFDQLISGYVDAGVKTVTDLPVVVFGDHSCTFKFVDFEFVRGADGTQLLKFDSEKFDTRFMCGYLSRMELTNANSYERHMKYLKNSSIVIPPLVQQKKIADDESKFLAKIASARKVIDSVAAKKSAVLDKYLKGE